MLFIQAAHTSAGPNLPPTRIVIHGTVSPTVAGGARAVADYFTRANSGGSAHYVVDPAEVVQCVHDDTIAWHAPPNARSIGVELCDPVTGPTTRWADPKHAAMLRLAATLVRELAAKYAIPTVRLTPTDLLAGRHGICGHVDVSQAWHQTDHTDPGTGFPWDRFLTLINATTPPKETDMPLTQADAVLVARELLGTMLGTSGPTVAVALQRAAAAPAGAPAGAATGFSLAQIAQAVNDDAARRQAS